MYRIRVSGTASAGAFPHPGIVFAAILASIGMLVTACSTASGDAATTKEALLDADREFARAAADRRLDGWMSFFAEDAAKIELKDGTVVRGLESIRERDQAIFADASVELRWQPADGGAFRDGEHGFTVGPYQVVRTAEDGTESVLSTGHYLTIWRRDDGRWKVILDTGTPDAADRD